MSKEVKTITAGHILSWIFGIIFLITGIGIIATTPIWGIIIILCSAMIIPYFNTLLSEKLHLRISGGVKFLLVIIILIGIGFAIADSTKETVTNNKVDTTQLNPIVGADSTVTKDSIPVSESESELNKKTDYVKNYLKLENIEVGEVNTYLGLEKTVSGKIRNTGDKSLDTIILTIYYLDSSNKRIGEKTHYPVYVDAFMADDRIPLKPNYVKDFSYQVSDEAPSGWANKVEVIISDITFTQS